MVYSDPNNTNSIVYQHTLLSYQLKTSHWNFSRAATLHLCNMADRGEKLQQPHCYHPFSDSRDTYLTKNHYENYSPKMVPTNPSGSWTIYQDITIPVKTQPIGIEKSFSAHCIHCICLSNSSKNDTQNWKFGKKISGNGGEVVIGKVESMTIIFWVLTTLRGHNKLR